MFYNIQGKIIFLNCTNRAQITQPRDSSLFCSEVGNRIILLRVQVQSSLRTNQCSEIESIRPC